jgi:hypothetical protein
MMRNTKPEASRDGARSETEDSMDRLGSERVAEVIPRCLAGAQAVARPYSDRWVRRRHPSPAPREKGRG